VSNVPPTVIRSPSRGNASGRWLAVGVGLAVTLAGGACENHPDESLAGLVVVSSGEMSVTDSEGGLEPIDAPPGDIRHMTASGGRVAIQMADDQLLVSDAPRAGKSRDWRPLALETSSNRTPSGMDLSLDSRLIAIVLGDPDRPGLDLALIEVETGEAVVRSIDLAANGPPTWFGPELVVLEVIRPDQHSGIATIDPTTGDVIVTPAQGIEPSVTRDGGRIAVAGPSGLVIVEPATWLAGGLVDAEAIALPAGSSLLAVALDADGTRLAVAYSASPEASSSVLILRLDGSVWENVSSITLPSATAVSIDWLD
jgi:hypothetical protein